jgi:purine nucleosidase
LEDASWFHGLDGLGDHAYQAPRRTVETQHAVEAIIDTVDANAGLELVTLGPLTNVALALQRKPAISKKVSRCVLMGGAPCCEGNVTPAAEFNIWVDPEAARIVFLSGMPIEMIGWELSRHQAVLDDQDIARILALKTPRAEFAIRCNSTAALGYYAQTGEHGIALPDPIAMAVLLNRALILSSSEHFVEIETTSALTRGMTVVDRLNVSADARNSSVWREVHARARKTKICWTLDIPGWKAALIEALR